MSRKESRHGDQNASNGESISSFMRMNARAMTPIISAAVLLLLLGASVSGLERLRRHVDSLPSQKQALKIELDLPADADWVDKEGWRPRILAAVELAEEQDGTAPDRLRRIARQMECSGWVSQVNRVMQASDGTIHVSCEYRRPIAMLLHEDKKLGPVYVPVDRQGYRLPEVYTSVSDSGSWIQILGVRQDLPRVGERFTADDARAAIQLTSLIFQRSFRNQIAAVDVRNFRGREDRGRDHILLWPKKGREIVWGSAMGEEIEEPMARDKLRNLEKYFASGTPQAHIDLSVYSNAVIERMPDAYFSSDGLASRRKQ